MRWRGRTLDVERSWAGPCQYRSQIQGRTLKTSGSGSGGRGVNESGNARKGDGEGGQAEAR